MSRFLRNLAKSHVLGGSSVRTAGGGVPPLLDVVPGATRAYSLRLLNSSYTGACIRVRRDSDDTEQDIGFVDGFLDTVSLLIFVGAGSGFIRTVYDQSGNEQHATQTVTTAQPRIVASGVLDISNGRAAMNWTTADHGLLIPTAQPAAASLFGVHDTTDTTFILYPSVNTSIFGLAAQDASASTGLNGTFGTPTLYTNGTLFAGSTRDDLHTALAGGQKISSALNCDLSNAAWATLYLGDYAVGVTNAFDYIGTWQELVLYASDMSASRATVEGNINAYWGVY